MLPWRTKSEVDGDLGCKITFWSSHDGCKQMCEQRSWSAGRIKRPCREEQARHRAAPNRESKVVGEASVTVQFP